MAGASGETAIIAPGRACGSCSLCCKLLRIGSLEKPNGTWCSHCKPGKGCLIYESRPQECRDFHCSWLTSRDLSDVWYPLNSKMVVDVKGQWVVVQVDPAYPTRWREEPYYSQIKNWSKLGVDNNVRVLVFIKKRLTVVFPNKELDLGEFDPGDHIMAGEVQAAPGGRDWHAYIRKAKDIPPEERDKFIVA